MPQKTQPPSQRLDARACALPPRPEGQGFSRLLVTDQVDLVAIVMARDMAAYDALCARLMAEIPMIRRINTQVVIEAMKVGLQVPVEAV